MARAVLAAKSARSIRSARRWSIRALPLASAGATTPESPVLVDGGFDHLHVLHAASGAGRLLVEADAFDAEAHGHGVGEQLGGGDQVLLADGQFHAAEDVGDEPVEPDHVVVDEKTL